MQSMRLPTAALTANSTRAVMLGMAVALLLVAVLFGSAPALAQSGGGKSIYSCVDSNGKRLTSDRPIPECNAREQREHNTDGSVKRIVPPTMTADERADAEARERDAATERAGRSEALRRDRNLLARFPNETAHNKAREAALEDMRKAAKVSETRLALLVTERKPLMDEAEFYIGKPLPTKLKTQIDGNDAATDALRGLLQNQQAEIIRVNLVYDAELERLRKLWGGAQPGTLGALPPVNAASAPRKAAAK